MACNFHNWSADLDRGPDWLFVRLHSDNQTCEYENLAESVWGLLDREFTHRVVIELDDVGFLRSRAIGELVRLHKRVHSAGGLMRLSGISSDNHAALRQCRLGERFPCYATREQAVMGCRPDQPR